MMSSLTCKKWPKNVGKKFLCLNVYCTFWTVRNSAMSSKSPSNNWLILRKSKHWFIFFKLKWCRLMDTWKRKFRTFLHRSIQFWHRRRESVASNSQWKFLKSQMYHRIVRFRIILFRLSLTQQQILNRSFESSF